MKDGINKLPLFLLIVVMAAFWLLCLPVTAHTTKTEQAGLPILIDQQSLRIALQRETRLLPGYSVFDWIEAEVKASGGIVLRGQVVRADLKKQAEQQIALLPDVKSIENKIEVLPRSYDDERLRSRAFLALFGTYSPMFRYATHELPPLHIVVKNGRVTLKGTVANAMDSQLAKLKIRGVRGVREVINELRIDNQLP